MAHRITSADAFKALSISPQRMHAEAAWHAAQQHAPQRSALNGTTISIVLLVGGAALIGGAIVGWGMPFFAAGMTSIIAGGCGLFAKRSTQLDRSGWLDGGGKLAPAH
ncbi:MAG: hypothetical protein AB7G06_03505 [Bdellovibrionales bacterium]